MAAELSRFLRSLRSGFLYRKPRPSNAGRLPRRASNVGQRWLWLLSLSVRHGERACSRRDQPALAPARPPSRPRPSTPVRARRAWPERGVSRDRARPARGAPPPHADGARLDRRPPAAAKVQSDRGSSYFPGVGSGFTLTSSGRLRCRRAPRAIRPGENMLQTGTPDRGHVGRPRRGDLAPRPGSSAVGTGALAAPLRRPSATSLGHSSPARVSPAGQLPGLNPERTTRRSGDDRLGGTGATALVFPGERW